MKRFAYTSLGILALTLAFHLGATSGRAGNPQFAFLGIEGGPGIYITSDGQLWQHIDGVGWRNAGSHLGMPLENVAAFQGRYLVDQNGQLWQMGGDGMPYQFIGSPPGTASLPGPSTTPSTWGRIKAGR